MPPTPTDPLLTEIVKGVPQLVYNLSLLVAALTAAVAAVTAALNSARAARTTGESKAAVTDLAVKTENLHTAVNGNSERAVKAALDVSEARIADLEKRVADGAAVATRLASLEAAIAATPPAPAPATVRVEVVSPPAPPAPPPAEVTGHPA